MNVTIYHNMKCGTSRNTLELIRHSGVEPEVIDYLSNPPAREQLLAMIAKAGLTVRQAIRSKEPVYLEMGLDDVTLSDDALIDAMLAQPVLINRPFVVAPGGVRLCRPAELVLDILSLPQKDASTK